VLDFVKINLITLLIIFNPFLCLACGLSACQLPLLKYREMSQTIDQSYLKEYSQQFVQRICSAFFGNNQFMTGEDILKLTPCKQLNLMVIKSLFLAWQTELEALKGNPYFDYGDPEVERVLNEFMNTLSRAIKIDRTSFEPLLRQSVEDTITLAVDPAGFVENELQYSAGLNLKAYFTENKKYIKWHQPLWHSFVQKTEKFTIPESLSMAFDELMDEYSGQMESADTLLDPLKELCPLSIDRLLLRSSDKFTQEATPVYKPLPELKIATGQEKPRPVYEQDAMSIRAENNLIDPLLAWEKFEQDAYGVVRGNVRSLREAIGINQRFMFTRKLFSGNPELLNEALAKLDACDSFSEAVALLNRSYVPDLKWDIDAEELHEFLFLIFTKFDDKP